MAEVAVVEVSVAVSTLASAEAALVAEVAVAAEVVTSTDLR